MIGSRAKLLVATVASLATLGVTSTASAVTLGAAAPPAGTTLAACSPIPDTTGEVVQLKTDGALDYTVPAGGSDIVSWSFDSTAATPGTPYGLVVARPEGAAGYTIVGSDVKNVPASPSAVTTYTLASPIAVQAGDVLGVVVEPTFSGSCQFTRGPAADVGGVFEAPLTPGGSLGTEEASTPTLVNISADVEPPDDASVTAHALPASVLAGGAAAFEFTVGAAAAESVTVTDTVPSGLSVLAASADNGSCATAGQAVTCKLSGTPSNVTIVVSAPTAGTYSDVGSVAGELTDPDVANDSATAALTVGKPATPATCHPANLAGIKLAQAKKLLAPLGCKVGKIANKSSKHVPKGEVISTSPSRGTKPLGAKVAIVVSSGKPKPKRH